MKKLATFISMFILVFLIAANAFADEARWRAKWEHEYQEATVNLILSGLRETPQATQNRALVRMIQLETQLSAVATPDTKFYSEAATSGDPKLFPMEVLFGLLKGKGITIESEDFFVGRTFYIRD